jgi:hypothetical protein
MKLSLRMLALAGALLAGGCVSWWGITGNDTGGIIPWSPESELAAPAMAAEHCARYGKVALFTSVGRTPGSFINFICTFTRNGRPVRY